MKDSGSKVKEFSIKKEDITNLKEFHERLDIKF